MEILKTLLEKTNQGKKCVMATVVEKTGDGPVVLGGRLLMEESGFRIGSIGGGAIEKVILSTCQTLLSEQRSQLIRYDLTGKSVEENTVAVPMICGGTVKIFYEFFEPKPRVFVFGSGNVGREVIKKLEGVGFKTLVIDTVEPEGISFDEYHDDYETVVNRYLENEDYVVISTGAHEVDYQILKEIVSKEITPKFLGMLASSKKSTELLKRLNEEIGKQPKQLHSPIGLNVGGSTPSEIAISIVAQLQCHRYKVENVEAMGVYDLSSQRETK